MTRRTPALRVATRASEQARAQAGDVAERLAAVTGRAVELVLVDTAGDRLRDRPIGEIGGQGVFTKEVQHAVLDARADIAVHSAKDLPSSWTTDGLVLAGVPERGDPRDALVGTALAALRHGATVATGSARRRTQLAHLRPDLRFVGLRGNIPTRVARANDEDIDATVVAVAGVAWVGLADRLADILDVATMVPQIGLGALAIECRVDDGAARAAIAAIEHAPSRRRVDAERAFLARLGGGCELPVGAHATIDARSGALHIVGLVASSDGREIVRGEITGDDATAGAALAERLLDEGGHLLR